MMPLRRPFSALSSVFRATAGGNGPAGWTRDYLLYVDGWCKDRDPNTITGQTITPLPFHAMTTYPPPDGEAFPTDEAHETWRREWNTR